MRSTSSSAVALCALFIAACASVPVKPKPAASPAATKPASSETPRRGRFWYFVDNLRPAPRAGATPTVKLWFALPINRLGQQVKVSGITPAPTEIIAGEGGNRVAYWKLAAPAKGRRLVLHFDVEVHNQALLYKLDPRHARLPAASSPEARRYTVSEPWLQRHEAIVKRARAIVGTETNPLKQAQLVFDWIVANVTYDYPAVKDRGVKKSFARLKGDCGEFSHIFITMVRSLGIPARLVTAVWYQGGGHAWAELFLDPFGWIPADTSGAQLIQNGLKGQLSTKSVESFMATRGIATRNPRHLFGNLYPHRMEVFVGENVPIVAKDGTRRVFRFMQPGGSAAEPAGVEVRGFAKPVVQGGFFMWGGNARDRRAAEKLAEEKLAPAYLQAKMFRRAERGLRKTLAKKPKSARANFQLGQALFSTARYREALEAFGTSINGKGGGTKRTTDTWSHVFSGMCHDALGERDKALAAYRRALEAGASHSGVQALAKKFIAKPFRPGPDKKRSR
jgi:transglutaminase-like putative cysteine protease